MMGRPMPDTSKDDDVGLRSIKSSAKFLGVGLTRLYELIKSGELDVVKVGTRGTRITQESLNRFIAERKVRK
jgi:excisionase family DNA binding protein